jgi:glycosyltransferase involved in cell wall biosynthesis
MYIERDTHPAPVLGLYVEEYAQAYYRLSVPLKAAFGAENVAVTAYSATTQEQRDAAKLVVTSRVQTHDNEPISQTKRLLDMIREGGRRRVLVDQDDDLSPWKYEQKIRLEAMLRYSDGVVCTNTTLAGRLRSYNPNVTIVPNYLDMTRWPVSAPQPITDKPVLLMTGGASHYQDWQMVVSALKAHQGRYRLRVVGFCPDYLEPFVTERSPWIPDLKSYAPALAGAHIALCPLPHTAFNTCKSPIKLYETALAGCAVIGSPTQYGPVMREAGQNENVAVFGRHWAERIGYYLDHPEQITADATALQRHIATTRDVARHADTIRQAYGGNDVLDNRNPHRRVEEQPLRAGRGRDRDGGHGRRGAVRNHV